MSQSQGLILLSTLVFVAFGVSAWLYYYANF